MLHRHNKEYVRAMSIRVKRKNQTRDALLQAALEQCASGQSFSSLSLRQVTKIAGVVPATFYRHFKDMEDLGRTLVNEEMTRTLATMYQDMELNKNRSYQEQISTSVDLFLAVIDSAPAYANFVVTERWGGSPAVCHALDKQLKLFVKLLAKDLGQMAAFKHIHKDDLLLLAELGSNMFISWIMGWLDINHSAKPAEINKKRVDYKNRCTRQAKLLFFGASNWDPKHKNTQSQTPSSPSETDEA